MKFPAIVNKLLNRPNFDPDIKARVLKNNDAILEIVSKQMKGAKSCPFLGGNKCIGMMCEHFLEFTSVRDDGSKMPYYRCAHVALPNLIIELRESLNQKK